MGKTVVEKVRELPYAPADLCKLVGDVTSYPHFLPWVKQIGMRQRIDDGDAWHGIADAVVGWHALTERFSSRVRCDPNKGEVDVSLVSGPFRSLENRWRFQERPNGAVVRFWISYEFRNPVLQTIASTNREKVASRLLEAFEAEAKRRFG